MSIVRNIVRLAGWIGWALAAAVVLAFVVPAVVAALASVSSVEAAATRSGSIAPGSTI